MSEDKTGKFEILPSGRRLNALARPSGWKGALRRVFGISEAEEHEREIRRYQSATEVIKAEIAFREAQSHSDHLNVSLAIDALQRFNRLLEEQISFLKLEAERGAEEDRARRGRESAAERIVRLARNKQERKVIERLSGAIGAEDRVLLAEVVAVLEREAGENKEGQERVRRVKEILGRAR